MNKDLLKLIETVNPDDTAMLDEIDARVWCLLNWSEYRGIKTHIFEGETKPEPCAVSSNGGTHIDNLIKYTRSRDALKSIRPEGWSVDTVSALKDDCLYFDATIWKIGAVLRGNLFTTRGGFLPTEELAELHVIISAITWERQNGK